jgi:hypothetical protein
VTGPAKRYVRGFTLARQQRTDGWNELEQAIVMTLIDWKVDSEMRPTFGEGSDCSDLMDVALARLVGLVRGHLTPNQILDAIEEANR